MQRVTITLPDALCAELDSYALVRGYSNRSEALRDLLRGGLRDQGETATKGNTEAMAVLTYVYDHNMRDLANRLMKHHHHHHMLGVTTTHVHLDHDTCLETVILRGPVSSLRAYADGVLAQRGVVHGNLFLIPVEAREDAHDHGDGVATHTHLHVRDGF